LRIVRRCGWAVGDLLIVYHDREWGVPQHDDRALFELLVLEGAQAGLSWLTVLRKRDGYRAAFDGFDPRKVARYSARQLERLLRDTGIIRNRQKVASAVGNARALLRVQEEFGSFDAYVWRFVDGTPVRGHWKRSSDLPASTPISDALSKDLRKRGFGFVGTTICYSFMQAVGLVDDHIMACFKYRK